MSAVEKEAVELLHSMQKHLLTVMIGMQMHNVRALYLFTLCGFVLKSANLCGINFPLIGIVL